MMVDRTSFENIKTLTILPTSTRGADDGSEEGLFISLVMEQWLFSSSAICTD